MRATGTKREEKNNRQHKTKHVNFVITVAFYGHAYITL